MNDSPDPRRKRSPAGAGRSDGPRPVGGDGVTQEAAESTTQPEADATTEG